MGKALQIDSRDNVAVVLSEVLEGEEILVTLENGKINIKAVQAIPFGHKICLRELPVDEPIIKYGEEIGKAKNTIKPGEWIHLHNVYCERGR